MKDKDWDLLADMLEYARDALMVVEDRSAATLAADRIRFLAACRAVEIVGEAASKVSAEGREALPHFAWRNAINMRNILAHDYGRILADVVVDTARNDLPPLIAALELLLKDAPE